MKSNIKIEKVTLEHQGILKNIGIQSFIESHGHSASKPDIKSFISYAFSDETLHNELVIPSNLYHMILYDDEPVGYSKIVCNIPHPEVNSMSVSKMERMYLIQTHYGKKLGSTLMKFNIDLAMSKNQHGIWLYVWKENLRAFQFYKKSGFKIIGEYDYRISPTHTNPNYVMYLHF